MQFWFTLMKYFPKYTENKGNHLTVFKNSKIIAFTMIVRHELSIIFSDKGVISVWRIAAVTKMHGINCMMEFLLQHSALLVKTGCLLVPWTTTVEGCMATTQR